MGQVNGEGTGTWNTKGLHLHGYYFSDTIIDITIDIRKD